MVHLLKYMNNINNISLRGKDYYHILREQIFHIEIPAMQLINAYNSWSVNRYINIVYRLIIIL